MKYILKNATLLDGTIDAKGAMKVQKNIDIAIDGDRIVSIKKDIKDTDGYEIVELSGKYVVPGLINMHVHLAASGKPPKANAKPVNYKKLFDTLTKFPFILKIFENMGLNLAKNYLLSGTTTIRTVGGILDNDSKARDLINAGKKMGPRIVACNTAVSVPGGHFAGSLATEAENAKQAVLDVEKIASTNPDWIKLMITGGVMDASAEGEPGVLRMTPDIVNAACKKAHELGYKVAAHIESPEGVKAALENGVDTIEHGAKPDANIIKLFKAKKAAHICTISPALPYVNLPEEISHCGDLGRKNGKVVVDGIIECAKQCIKNGIPVGIGTDGGCNFVTAYDTWRELYYFSKYVEVTPAFALHTATQVNAEILGMQDEIGTIQKGKCADMLIVDNNPIEDLKNLRNPYMVVNKGQIIKNIKIKRRKDVEEALQLLM